MYITLRSVRFVLFTLLSVLTLAIAISSSHTLTSATHNPVQLADDVKPNPGG